LQPLIYVKGGDYAGAQEQEPDLTRLPEVSSVLLYGGSIRLIPYLSGHSTTELVAAIKQLPGKMA
jgi:bifunctional ADP-heptose synthase (sugar kinase/adenylyltransferase)